MALVVCNNLYFNFYYLIYLIIFYYYLYTWPVTSYSNLLLLLTLSTTNVLYKSPFIDISLLKFMKILALPSRYVILVLNVNPEPHWSPQYIQLRVAVGL